ncbi:glycosyltransferase [Altericroceibacterium xinjiangense]|uniref:glycosyltransferase n=1 Tax=Altericroceibacterium xinjiangense TaxID=762261 RepID=UPI0013E0D832|nr:glycosyltransferase [Altericroceibacterium xinjiangense]
MTLPPNDPPLSVLLSAHNAEAFLDEAIESVLAQDFPAFEFLILDDGSQDATRAIAEGYAARDARIRVIAGDHRGLVDGLNRLLEEARAPIVARFDADDICHPQRFSRQMQFLEAHPDHGLVGCETDQIDSTGAPRPDVEYGWVHDHEEIVRCLPLWSPLVHPAVMMRRDVVREAGGYRRAYRRAEDYDLWLRLSTRTKLANLPERLLWYRVHPGQVGEKHLVEQVRAAATALLAHRQRLSGKPDPTEGLASLPPTAALDALFGPGSAAFVNQRVFEEVLYVPGELAGAGWDAALAHAAASRDRRPLWRVATRLLRAGHPAKAGRFAAALLMPRA